MARFELNEILNGVFDPISATLRVDDQASTQQKRLDYDVRTDTNPVYVGFGIQGKQTSDGGWVIQKITYDGSNRITLIQSAVGIWDNRASITYS